MQGKWNELISLLEKSASNNSKDNSLKSQLAQAYISAGKTEESLRVYNDLIKSEPNNIFYKDQLAEIYLRMNKTDEALKYLESLLQQTNDEMRKNTLKSRIEQIKQMSEMKQSAGTVAQSAGVQQPAQPPVAGPVAATPPQSVTLAPVKPEKTGKK
jgi:thioredoxin-like negative regulator of GroEL